MTPKYGFNALHHWLHSGAPDTTVIGSSATPALSLIDIIELSTSPEETHAAFKFIYLKLPLGSAQGLLKLRETVAALYDSELSQISASNVIIANGTTGANHMVHQALLKPGDHVICQYPIYGPLIEEPLHIGCDVSYLCLDSANGWQFTASQLESLIRPGETKLLVLNNPVNPTGTHFDTKLQEDVISLCKKHDITLHVDEIFRPLFHSDSTIPKSFIEHHSLSYEKIIVTCSLSKTYGLSGVRIGWIATRCPDLHAQFMNYRLISCMSVSIIDELIAVEALSPRCRPGILQKHLSLAKHNIRIIQSLVDKHSAVCDWVPPTAGAVGFIRFKSKKTGEPVDDVKFCTRLFERKNVLMAPASLCFEFEKVRGEFKGRVRIHFTGTTKNLEKGVKLLDEFLEEGGVEQVEESGLGGEFVGLHLE